MAIFMASHWDQFSQHGLTFMDDTVPGLRRGMTQEETSRVQSILNRVALALQAKLARNEQKKREAALAGKSSRDRELKKELSERRRQAQERDAGKQPHLVPGHPRMRASPCVGLACPTASHPAFRRLVAFYYFSLIQQTT